MDLDRDTHRIALLVLAAILYLALVTHGGFDPFGAGDRYGLAFNSMLLHLLHGRFDVDPATIGREAFVHDGRSYAYFGIFPALLRLPLLPFLDLRGTHVERLSCWLAMLTGAVAHVAALRAAFSRVGSRPIRQAMLAPLLLAALLSGPAILLGPDAAIYHEPILWAWALAMIFVALAMHGLVRRRRFDTGTLLGMATAAGLCLLTRVTTGTGLFVALGLILLDLALRGRAADGGRFAGLRQRRFWLPALLLVGFAAVAAGVNAGRWGNPLIFADLRDQIWLLAEYPDRLPRLARYGLFDIRRLGFGVLYYFLPVWGGWIDAWLPLHDRIADLFDALEMPAGSFFLTDPLAMLLAAIAVIGLLRGRIGGVLRRGGGLLLLGLAIPPALMMTAWYMAFRYRAEFAPFLAAAACLAAAAWAERLQAEGRAPSLRLGRVLACLALLQIGGTEVQSLAYRFSRFGPSSGLQALDLPAGARAILTGILAVPRATTPACGGAPAHPGATAETHCYADL